MAYDASAYGGWVGTDDWRAWVGVTKTSDTATQCVLKVEAWVWSQYGTTSGYSNIRGGTATGSNSWDRGSATSITTNSWKKLYEKSYTIAKTHSAQSGSSAIKCWALAEGISGIYSGSSSSASVNVAVSAKTSYAVTYNANSHGTAPSSQVKWHGESLTLASAISATGYTFKGWNTNSAGTGTNYSAGASYTGNAALTLYAKWQAVTYAVTYNANGGSGAPSSQTKTYGTSLTLSSTRPTRTGYEFLGWATSSSATTATYQPGATYSTNAALSLYAVWRLSYAPPTITGATAWRCDSGGTAADDGAYALVQFAWAVDSTDSGEVDTVTVRWRQRNASTWAGSSSVSASGTSGSVSAIVGGSFSDSVSYDLQAVVTDTHGSTTTATMVLSPSTYTLDFLAGGTGIAVGKAATRAGLDVAWDTYHDGTVSFTDGNALPSAGTSADFYATGIRAFANGGGLWYKGKSDFLTWLGASSGVWPASMIPNLDASKITAGTVARARIENTAWAYLVGNASASSYLRWRMVAGIVFIQANLTGQSIANPNTKVLGTVPSGYRPSKQVSSSATANNNNVVSLWVKTDGTVNCGPLGGTITSIYGHITYPLG